MACDSKRQFRENFPFIYLSDTSKIICLHNNKLWHNNKLTWLKSLRIKLLIFRISFISWCSIVNLKRYLWRWFVHKKCSIMKGHLVADVKQIFHDFPKKKFTLKSSCKSHEKKKNWSQKKLQFCSIELKVWDFMIIIHLFIKKRRKTKIILEQCWF